MQRYKLTIEYDGTPFSGWQRQDDRPSVQQTVEDAIAQYTQQALTLTCAGRTDAGVHAFGQVAHVDLLEAREEFSVRQGINFYLVGQPVSVVKAEKVDETFHARFDAVKRHYEYRVLNRPSPPAIDRMRVWHVHQTLDLQAMRAGASYLVGSHDYTSFRATECQSKSPLKSIDRIDIVQAGEHISIVLSARSFLHHQVRNIVGTLSLVGLGKWQPEQVQVALAAKDRSAAGPTAPAHGLYFMQVDYAK